MKRFSRFVLRSILLSTVSIFFAGIAVAQDVLTVGQGATCITGTAGQTVTVPVFIRDASATPLGIERPAAERIQAVSFQVTPTNPSAIAVDTANRLQITFTRAGVTAGLTPLLESTTRTTTTSAYLVSYDQATDRIAFTSNAGAPGDLFVNMNVQIAAGAAPGTTINLTLNPTAASTALSNQAGTILETTVNGNLALVSGCILIPAPPAATISIVCPAAFNAGTTAVGTVTISAAQTTGTTIFLSSSNTLVATVPANVVIPAGATSVTFTVTGTGAGSSTITATPQTVPSTAQTCTVTVTAPVTTSITPPAAAACSAGATCTGMVTISAARGVDTTFTLSSSNPSVATVPLTVVIPAGATSATFNITGVSAGDFTITATPPAGLGAAQTSPVIAVGQGVAIPALGPFGLLLLVSLLALAGYFVTKTMS